MAAQRAAPTTNGDTRTYSLPAGTGKSINDPRAGGLITDNAEAQQIITNADFFKIGGGYITLTFKVDLAATETAGALRYICKYGDSNETHVVGGSNPILFNSKLESVSGPFSFDVETLFSGPIEKLFKQEMYTVNGVWPLYKGANVLGKTLSDFDAIKEAYDFPGNKFNWSLNDNFLSGVKNNGNGWDDHIQGMETNLTYALDSVTINDSDIVSDVLKKRYAFKMTAHLNQSNFNKMDWEEMYEYVIKTRDKIREKLKEYGGFTDDILNDRFLVDYTIGAVDPLLPDPPNYRSMESNFNAWYDYWKSYLGQPTDNYMWDLWCLDGNPFEEGTTITVGKKKFFEKHPISTKVYLPYLVQFLPTGQLLNLQILDAKKPDPYVKKYTTCVYDPTTQEINIHPYGRYEEGPTEKEKALIRVTASCDDPTIFTEHSSETSFQFETPKLDLPLKEVVDYGELPPVKITPNPTEDKTVTIKLYLNPPNPEGSEKHDVTETKNPPLYEDNVIEFKITIPAGNKSNNLEAVSLSNFKSSKGSCSVSAKYLYTNVLKKNMPGTDKKTDFTLDVYYHDPKTDSNPTHDMSKLSSAATKSGQVPIELNTIGSKSHKINFSIDPDYKGYISLHYRVNPSWDKPKEETNLDDNDVWLVVQVGDPDPPGPPPEPNKHEVKYNDRVSAVRMTASAFQTKNDQDLKHDGVPHKDTGTVQTTPCLPMADNNWFKCVEAGKFTAYQHLSNWSEKPWLNPMPNEVPPNYCWGELTTDPHTIDIIEYCPTAEGGDENTPGACPWCGKPCYAYAYKQTLLACDLPYPTPAGSYDNRFISFVYATDKLLKEGNTEIQNDPNVTQWTTKMGNFCHEETYYVTETDSEGNEHTIEKKRDIYTTWFKRANEFQWLTYRARRNDSYFDCNAFDYKTKSQESKSGYGFGVDSTQGYNTDYIEVYTPLKVASFIQFPYFSNYNTGPWEVTWLNLKNFLSGSSVSDITEASFEMPLNIKDYSKQPIGYRYSILNAPEKFTHVNLPNGNLRIFNGSFIAVELKEAWQDGVMLPGGSGTKDDPNYLCGLTINDPDGTGKMTSPIKIESNMWNDSYSVVDNEGAEQKSGSLVE